MLRTVCVRPTLWEAMLPPEALVMPPELAAVGMLLDDPRFFEPFQGHCGHVRFQMRLCSGVVPRRSSVRAATHGG